MIENFQNTFDNKFFLLRELRDTSVPSVILLTELKATTIAIKKTPHIAGYNYLFLSIYKAASCTFC
jgi:hypothetical protein